MPPKPKIDKQMILNAAFSLVREKGIRELNARSLAKKMNCSTNPIFRVYSNMEQLKKEVIEDIYLYYRTFTNDYIHEDELYSVSYAYIEFARKEKNLFDAIYISNVSGKRTLEKILNSTFNRHIVNQIIEQYNLNNKEAEKLLINVRFYTHGIATQVLVDSINLSETEIKKLLLEAISKFKK